MSAAQKGSLIAGVWLIAIGSVFLIRPGAGPRPVSPVASARSGSAERAMRTVDWILRAELSMVGYLAGPRLGALTYNLVHNLVIGLAALAVGWFAAIAPLAIAGAVLVAHAGMDRSLGYGLKLPTDFKDTHLGRIGR